MQKSAWRDGLSAIMPEHGHERNKLVRGKWAGWTMPLNWDSTYEIAMELRRLHPSQQMDELSLGQIHAWTLALPEFDDDPALVNDDILYAILQDWLEENLNDD